MPVALAQPRKLALALLLLVVVAVALASSLTATDAGARPDDEEPARVLSLSAGGQFVFWDLGPAQAADLFGPVKIAWLFDPDALSWTSFIPALGVVNFPLRDGDVLWIVSQAVQEIVIEPGFPQVRVRAPIDAVEINIAESFPVQVFVHILSGLPSGCDEFDALDVARDGLTIRIDVWNLAPAPEADIACTTIYGTVEHNVALGSDFESGREYSVLVNDIETTFVAQ